MSLLPMLETICGKGNTTDSEVQCLTYTLTQSPNLFLFPLKKPDYVAYPQTTDQVAAVMRLANRTKTPVLLRGSGSSSMSGNVSLEGGILIDMRHMDKILEINEDNMVVVAEGGCSVNKILRECYNKGLLLPLAPEWQASPQIGASINTNATGHYINKTGRLGDQVVGVEVVIPTGEVITLGSGAYKWGAHYHKYAGIPDLLGLFINAGGTMGCVTKVALRLKTWPKMKHMAYYWKSDEIDKVTQAHYDLQRYAEIFSIELLNHNTAFPLRGIEIQPPIEIPDDVGFLMLIIQDGLTDEELAVRTKIAKEILAKNSGRDLGDIWERLAGPPKYWWYTMYCDTLYGGGLKPAAGEKVSIGLNSACTMIYCPTKMFPKVYKLGYDIYVKKYKFPEKYYLWYGWADRNAMDPYPMFFFDGTNAEEVKVFAEFWREFHLEAAKLGCISYNIGIGHPKEMREWLGPAFELYKKIKGVLDPNSILNMPAAS
jgi:FAD/FMN-containing dehydrogenase